MYSLYLLKKHHPQRFEEISTRSHNPEWLAKIVADPDNDEIRLAYPRALRESRDPVENSCGTYIVQAIDVSRDLHCWQRHESHLWLPKLPEGITIEGWEFWRGFLTLIALNVQNCPFLDDPVAVLDLAPSQHLNIYCATKQQTALVVTAPWLARLKSLSISACSEEDGPDDEEIARLIACPHAKNLCWLEVMGSKNFTKTGIEALAKATVEGKLCLDEVRLDNCKDDPHERLWEDQGVVVGSDMPEFGKDLELRYGRIEWLHPRVEAGRCFPRSRFGGL